MVNKRNNESEEDQNQFCCEYTSSLYVIYVTFIYKNKLKGFLNRLIYIFFLFCMCFIYDNLLYARWFLFIIKFRNSFLNYSQCGL